LDYPRPNFPVVHVREVCYQKIAGGAWLLVAWDAAWEGLSHADHNGPYLYFRICGGYLWAQRHDVRIHIDRMDWTMRGYTSIFLESDEHLIHRTSTSTPFISTIRDQLHIEYENPNSSGWRRRVGNRIIAELQRNYEDRIAQLAYDSLFKEFIEWRMEEVSRPDDGFWTRWRDWVSRQERPGGCFSFA
jgi:hypothetical protein